VDGEILKAAQIDGASTYAPIADRIPIMRPVFLSDLVLRIWRSNRTTRFVRHRQESGGAAELPSTFMYSYTFTRNQWR